MNAVELNWTAVAGAARYHLALYTVADGHQRLDDVVAPTTTYTHPSLTAGTTYYYWVRAASASGEEGEWSVRMHATASATQSSTATPTLASNATATPTVMPTATATPASTPTPTPTATASTQPTATPTLTPNITGKLPAPALTADAKGANAVELNWTAVSGAARYQLWVFTTADGQRSLAYVAPPATTYTHPDLTAGRTYYYWVRALSAAGEEGDWSVRKHATPSDEQSPTATPTTTPTTTATATATPASNATATPTATATVTPTPPDRERAALIALYNATGGANWRRSVNWLSNEPLSTWFNVITNDNGHVTSLRLSGNRLSGSVPDLSALTYLINLDLSHNRLSGPVPDLSALSKLTWLFLNNNEFRGQIPDLSALSDLWNLNLAHNQLSGPFPDLSALTYLIKLDLTGNPLCRPAGVDLSGSNAVIADHLNSLSLPTCSGAPGNADRNCDDIDIGNCNADRNCDNIDTGNRNAHRNCDLGAAGAGRGKGCVGRTLQRNQRPQLDAQRQLADYRADLYLVRRLHRRWRSCPEVGAREQPVERADPRSEQPH